MAHNEEFEWDDEKNRWNQRKHGISFEEASEVFLADHYLEIFDDLHSDIEDRFIAIGRMERGLVTVVFTEDEQGTIRLISARLATKREARAFLVHQEQR